MWRHCQFEGCKETGFLRRCKKCLNLYCERHLHEHWANCHSSRGPKSLHVIRISPHHYPMPDLSTEERYNKGIDFQKYVKGLLSHSGYLEGQLYSTSGTYEPGYAEQLNRLGKLSYTSPDITILNSWDHPEKGLDKRYGIACSRRDTKFTRYNKTAVTFPRFQSHALREIQDEMGLPIFVVFGRLIGNNSYA